MDMVRKLARLFKYFNKISLYLVKTFEFAQCFWKQQIYALPVPYFLLYPNPFYPLWLRRSTDLQENT